MLKRKLLLIAVLLSAIMFSGLVFGWAPMLLLLEDEGQYTERCSVDGNQMDQGTCEAQENQLNFIYTMASFAVNAGALPVGVFLDYFGPTKTLMVAFGIEFVGLLLMAFSDSVAFDFFTAGYVCLAVGGQITMLSAFPSSFLVPEYQTMVLAAISSLFDASSIVFLGFYALHTGLDISRKALFLSYAVAAILVYGTLIYLYSINEGDLKETKNTATPIAKTPEEKKLMIQECHMNYGALSVEATLPTSPNTVDRLLSSGDAVMKLSQFSIGKQLRSYEFMFGLIFASVQILRTNVYIGTNNKLLENYGDDQDGFWYTKLFSLVLPLGFLFIPAIDYIVEQCGLAASLYLTTIMGIAYNILAILPSLPLQCLVFFIFAGYRAFLYSVISAYNAKIFGLKNLGKIIGIIFTTGAVVNLIEYPAVIVTNKYFAGNLTPLYMTLVLLAVAMFPLIRLYVKRDQLREERHRMTLASTEKLLAL